MPTNHEHPKRPAEPDAARPGIRLQRYLASAGLGSRRHCEEFILAGRVSVDGQVVRDLGTRVEPGAQQVRVDGEFVRREPLRYFLVNKPRGYLTTSFDPAGRPRVIDLVPAGKLRLFAVGRLDEGSEGLILVTNDGEIAHRLAHPRFQVPRTYAVQVAGRPTGDTLDLLKRGIHFHEGRFHVDWIRRAGHKGNSTFLEVGLTHGQNREIRRLFARVGHKVMRLRRISFGPLKLSRLPEGRARPLTDAELRSLRALATGPPARAARGRRPAVELEHAAPRRAGPPDERRARGGGRADRQPPRKAKGSRSARKPDRPPREARARRKPPRQS
jgi:23S rRNA pseudouridine2605 synthase